MRKPRYQDKESIRFCNRIAQLFKKACQLAVKFNHDHICQLKADIFQHRLYCALHTICSAKLADDNAETLKNRLLDPKKEYQRLFTFLKYPDVQPTNNHAEQSLRNMVIFRKICFGTRSTDGSYSHSVLPSLLLTAKRQGEHPLDFFQTLFTCDTATAQNALYNNSS
ncbi:MAG: IS66 family transposase [Planctomycetota bacterium]